MNLIIKYFRIFLVAVTKEARSHCLQKNEKFPLSPIVSYSKSRFIHDHANYACKVCTAHGRHVQRCSTRGKPLCRKSTQITKIMVIFLWLCRFPVVFVDLPLTTAISLRLWQISFDCGDALVITFKMIDFWLTVDFWAIFLQDFLIILWRFWRFRGIFTRLSIVGVIYSSRRHLRNSGF